ncbi:AsmA family protein [Methylophaga sp. OBS4]|uniref:AsmA family protein n=1 Tax=Methylophaga sp. OBS4 TaxID=2991935 RepID=UPI002250F9CE|nr:AsmA family protein [Methylophaga sp. OBS4]MCX4188566.1 AsmA family protein [Methylophaga sp. OBS4]
MRTALKLIFAVVIIVVAGLIALPFIVDPNDYKDEISSQVEKATGRTLTLQGDIGLSVFPWIALELGPLSLSNAEGFKADAFAQVEAAEIRIKLMPLLKKQLEMDTVVLDGLVLNLETDKNGKTNWDDLTATDDSKAKDKPETPPSKEPSAPALATISIAGVKLTNANILWSDASKGENYQLRNLNLNTDPLVPGKPTAVDMAFDLISAKPEAKAHVTLNTKITVDMENQQYALDDVKFTTIAEGKALPFSQADVALNGNVKADMVKQLVDITDLVVTAKTNKDAQAIDARMTGKVSSNLATQQTTVEGLNLTANIKDPALPGKQAELKLNTNLMADLQQQTLTLSALIVELQEMMLTADIKANKILTDNPTFAGNAHINPFNLRKLAGDLDIDLPEMADTSTLELMEIKAELEGSASSINAKQLIVTLDQSTLSGQLAINNFASPAFNFKLKLDEIDADRYLPPVEEGKGKAKPAASPATTAAAGSSELPLDTLRQINAKGSIDIGKMKLTGIRSENIHITVNAADGLVKLTPMRADLYQGKYNGDVTLDARGKTLKLAIDENLKGVQAGPLLQDMTGDAKISGTASANTKLTGNGATVEQIKQTLSGNGGFSFTDGALQGINIAESIRIAKAALKGEKLPESDAPVQTDFSSLSGTFKATNGVIDNQDLEVKSPLLRINGAGQASLPDETINYNLKVAVVGTVAGQGGKELAELKGVTIPVKISGTFSEPKPSVDLASMVKDQAKEELKAKAEEKLKDKLGDGLGGLLGGALGTQPSQDASAADNTESAPEEEPSGEEEKTPEKQLEDAVKDKLKGFF